VFENAEIVKTVSTNPGLPYFIDRKVIIYYI